MKLIFATNNPHKLTEAREILSELDIEVLSLQDLNLNIEIVEDAPDFEGNARKKAHTIFELTNIPTFADDSGLMVDALNGEPGIYSSRYANVEHDYQKNNEKLLNELKNKPKPHRSKFVCVINFKSHQYDEIFVGEVTGEIIDEQRGTNGFGYDPLFKPDGFEVTYAELPSEIKNKISHRYKALMKMKEFLMEKYLKK